MVIRRTGVRDILRSLLSEVGCPIIATASGHEALALAAYFGPVVAILDLAIPDDSAVDCRKRASAPVS